MHPKFPLVAAALQQLPDGTILDGEVVALDEKGRSDFGLLQNFRSAAARIHFYGFDILALRGDSLIELTHSEQRRILEDVLPQNEHISLAVVDPRPVKNLLSFAKSHGLEGVVSKNLESRYGPGRQSGIWCKHRINEGQEFVIGGYTPGSNGFVPATRRQVYKPINDKRASNCPFVNLPDKEAGRWGRA
jgi:bifunctional non-homologous end joining protein LigD